MEHNNTRMAEEYNELLCQAINTIVAANLNELKFDKTIVCTIIDISERKNGKYIATDGSITFEAFSDYTNYLKGDQVQVTIPNGDWSAQKTIIGRHSSDTENNPIVHILPTDSVADLTGNIVESKYDLEFGITANSDTELLQVCMFDNLAYDTEVHNTLCVKADFKTVLSNYNLQSGVYGLFIRLYTNNEGPVLTFNLSSDKDMFGRVYNFQDWVPQEQKFKFSSSIGVITKIEVFLAQDKNFIHKNDSGEEVQIEPTLTPNIFVRHLNIFLGVDMSTIVDNTVKIYTNDGSKYGKENNIKTIKLIWYNKGEGNKFLSFSDGDWNKEKAKSQPEIPNEENYYWIEWFADTKAGYLQYLKEFDKATQINYTFTDLPMTEVKAIVWLNGVSHESKLQFFNELGDVAGKFDVEYSFTELLDENNNTPDKAPDEWYDPTEDLKDKTLNDAIWMATRSSDDGGETWTQWVVTRIRGNDGDSPYLIELTNDSATVGIDVNGDPIGLAEVTTTRVIVYRGSQNITNDCIYTWSAGEDEVSVEEGGKKAALTSMSADTAELTVEVKYTVEDKTINIGSKSLTVSKIPSTATYKLVATPQVINMTTSLREITFKVIKYTKEQSIEIPEPGADLQIILSKEKDDDTTPVPEVTITGFSAKVNDSFNGATFELQTKKPNTTDEWFTWDRETVSVQRGSQYTSTIFKRSAIGDTVSPPGGYTDKAGQIPVDYFNPLPYEWFDGIPADGGPLIWMSSAVFENIAGFTPTWSTPVLAMDVEGKFDVQYSYKSEPGDPNNEGAMEEDWVDATGNQTIHNALWMATRSRIEGGSWTPWVVTRIKGEDGESPYTIDLSNDSATIGTDSSGIIPENDATLKAVSTTTVTVYLGTEKQEDLIYDWSVKGGSLSNNSEKTVWFTKLNDDVDTGSATVTVKSDDDNIIGTKTFTISKSKQGYTPQKGIDYFDGANGTNGTSIIWQGSFDTAPLNPQDGWAYYNKQAKASYVYQGGAWYQMSIDGINGQNGKDGFSIVWKGEFNAPPPSAQTNWVYKDIDDGIVYIYNGAGWEPMVVDGTDGADGINGADGLSVFITYNNSESKPSKPSGNGTTNGWHTEATPESVWMSQKVAENSESGVWGEPIKVKGQDAISYELIVSPTSWNGTQNPEVTVQFTVIKIQGTDRSELNNKDYVIKVGDNNIEGTSYKITDTTTFTLLIDNDIWDTATVDKVVDGSKGDQGPQGEDGPQGITGTKTEAVRIYYGTNQSEIPSLAANWTPSTDSTSPGVWTLQPVSATESAHYVFTSTGVKTTTYDASNIAQTPTYSSWTTPELFKAYNTNGIDQQNYATYLRITNFKTNDGLYYTEIDGVQKLAINATYIKTGTFVVEEGNTTIFSAGWSKNTNGQIIPSVTMAGWMVDGEKISKNFNTGTQMVLSSGGVSLSNITNAGTKSFVIAAGTNFGVTADGTLYANGANITGVITATGGKIGDWLIDGSLLKSTNGILTLNGQNGSISSSSSSNSFSLIDGKLSVKNADIQGHIEADTGNIGQLKIEDGALYGSIIYYQPISDPIAFRIIVSNQPAGQYKVDKYNNHTWHNYIYAVVSGEKINTTNVDSNNVEFYFVKEYPTTDGQYAFVQAKYGNNLSSYTVPSGANYLIINQPKTYSTNNGAPIVTNASATDYTFSLTTNGLKCTAGEVGGWKITKNAIESDTTTLWANGTIQCRSGGTIVFGKTYLDCSLFGDDRGVLTYLGTTFNCSAYLCANAIYVPNPNEYDKINSGLQYIKLIFNGAEEEGVTAGSVTWEKVSNIGDAGTNESNE